MDLEYSITENVHRNGAGQIVEIEYQFEETVVVEIASSNTSTTITRQNKEKRNRTYDTRVTREQYQNLTHQLSNPLSFEEFVIVLRPFIMGFYTSDELERAFQTLDRDHSGSIHINELSSFLPLLNDTIDINALRNYVGKVDENFDGNMNYDEFRSLVLRGIGRDIICNHL
jgi:Ca2+-binding EF-hand superfamily protein